MKRAKAGLIPEQRPARHGHAARKQNFDGSVQPNHRNAGIAQEFRGTGLRIGATAESENGGFVKFHGATEGGAQLIGFELAEGRFTVAFEKSRDGNAGSFFNALIEVDETPAELTSQACADGAFTRTHETGETKNGGARLKGLAD